MTRIYSCTSTPPIIFYALSLSLCTSINSCTSPPPLTFHTLSLSLCTSTLLIFIHLYFYALIFLKCKRLFNKLSRTKECLKSPLNPFPSNHYLTAHFLKTLSVNEL